MLVILLKMAFTNCVDDFFKQWLKEEESYNDVINSLIDLLYCTVMLSNTYAWSV